MQALEPGASITGLLRVKGGSGEEKRIHLVLGSEQNSFSLSVHMLTGLCPQSECTETKPVSFPDVVKLPREKKLEIF